MGRGAAGCTGRRLPALPPCPERRLSRAPERGRGLREGGGGRASGGQGEAGQQRRVPAAATRPPPRCRRRAEASPGRGGPGRAALRAGPAPAPSAAPALGMCGAPRPAGPRSGAGGGGAALAAGWGGGEVRGELRLRLGASQFSPAGKICKFQRLDPKWLRSHGLGSISKSLTRPLGGNSCFLFASTRLGASR